jgi:hypothetical protein
MSTTKDGDKKKSQSDKSPCLNNTKFHIAIKYGTICYNFTHKNRNNI